MGVNCGKLAPRKTVKWEKWTRLGSAGFWGCCRWDSWVCWDPRTLLAWFVPSLERAGGMWKNEE